jgi:hypothetical protein
MISGRERESGTVGEVPRECHDRFDALRVVDRVSVVDDQHERRLDLRHRVAEARQDLVLYRGAGRCQRFEYVAVERGHAIERRRDVREQHDRIVVLLVGGDPGESPPRQRAGPLREQGRLAVARSGVNDDDLRPRRTVEPLEQVRARDAALGDLGRLQLGLEQLERRTGRCLRSLGAGLHRPLA